MRLSARRRKTREPDSDLPYDRALGRRALGAPDDGEWAGDEVFGAAGRARQLGRDAATDALGEVLRHGDLVVPGAADVRSETVEQRGIAGQVDERQGERDRVRSFQNTQ